MNEAATHDVRDRAIGDIIRDLRNLSADNVQNILEYQRNHGVRFGDAAVALGHATAEDVMVALSQQFHYPYAPSASKDLSDELVTLKAPFTPAAEAFRAIRTRLLMRSQDAGTEPVRRALAVVSPDVADGKSYFAANLAVSLAQLGRQVLLVDADMRSPRQHELFKLENQAGLSTLLSGRSERQVIKRVSSLHELCVLPVGGTPPNPLELVERPAFSLLMRELVLKFDHVVVDTPASVLGADAVAIAARCGSALVVARRDASRLQSLGELTSALSVGATQLAGVVYNEY